MFSTVAYVLLVLLFAAVIVYFSVKKVGWMKKTYDNNPEVQKQRMEEELAALETQDFEAEFFRRCDNGEESVLFMKISSQQDCAVLRSLLYSADVPSYVESEHSSGMYGNAADVNIGIFAMKLYVLRDDYEEAAEIARDFISQKEGSGSDGDANGLRIFPL